MPPENLEVSERKRIILLSQFSPPMLISLTTLLATLCLLFRSRAALELENLALRHQIGVLQRSARKRPRLTAVDRLLWVWLSRIWGDWRSALAIVRPETVVAWHRAGFRLFWTWKVRRGQHGRPTIARDVRDLIRKMCRQNPGWGAPRIHGELLKLGIDVAESSVSKYMVRCRKPPSQTWRTFLDNHLTQLVSIDFFTVPTIRFHVLYVFLILAHDRRRILHFNVTAHPTAEWTGQQLREAFPFDQLPRYPCRILLAYIVQASLAEMEDHDHSIGSALEITKVADLKAAGHRSSPIVGSILFRSLRSNPPLHTVQLLYSSCTCPRSFTCGAGRVVKREVDQTQADFPGQIPQAYNLNTLFSI